MNKQNGFTLIELVVVVAILGILASIAVPSYRQYIEKTHCEDGKQLLTNAANQMERGRAANGGRYNANTPINHSSTIFTIAASDVTATSYTLTANTTSAASISGNLTLTAANAHGGSLAGQCTW